MTDELMAELRGVYEDAYWGVAQSAFDTRDPQLVAVMALARYSAERQRGMEATEKMLLASYYPDVPNGKRKEIFCAMQSAAPLWVDVKPLPEPPQSVTEGAE